MNPVFGIHIGNTTCGIAICRRDDSPFYVAELLMDNTGERMIPALVNVGPNNEVIIGTPCKSLMISRWSTTVTNNKRLLGRTELEVTNGERRVATVILHDAVYYKLPVDDENTRYTTPRGILEYIYIHLYEIARSVMPGDDNEIQCVLMVPHHFSVETQMQVKASAEQCGWKVLQVIHEASAVILGYDNITENQPITAKNVLVYRLGGRSCEVTVYNIDKGLISLLGTEYSEDVGGKFLISALTNHLAEEFHRRYKLDPQLNYRSMAKLTQAAQTCMHILSKMETANCFVESLCEGVDFSHTVSRARFESIILPLLNNLLKPLLALFEKLEVQPNDINVVYLCGGPFKIPRLRKFVVDLFDTTCTLVKPLPGAGWGYDEILAIGASYQAALITTHGNPQLEGVFQIPQLATPIKIDIVLQGRSEQIVIPGGTYLPYHTSITVDGGSVVTLKAAFEGGDGEDVFGRVEMEGLNGLTEFHIRVNIEHGICLGIPDENNVIEYYQVIVASTDEES